MPVISGSISGSIKSVPYDIPATITSFSIINRSAGSITVTLGFVVSGADVYYRTATLATTGASYGVDLTELRMMAGTKILIIASGQADYYITIEP